jgi:hypothetical protein
MAFTDHSDLFAAVHEDGMNLLIRHIMRQRPSLFNYATEFFARTDNPPFCVEIDAAPEVAEAGQPLFTEQEPLPIVGTFQPLALNFCLQVTDVSIDLHPGDTLTLPPELGTLEEQQFALHVQVCVGMDCPRESVISNLLAEMEVAIAMDMFPAGPQPVAGPVAAPVQVLDQPGALSVAARVASASAREGDPQVVATQGELVCMCLHAFGVGHFEWGTIGQFRKQWLKVRLDGLEIVDLQTVPPTPLEEMVECYLRLVLRLGILPQLTTPMESLVLNITEMLLENDVKIHEQITLAPTAAPAVVPNNPAIEENQLKAFLTLDVKEV